MSQINFLLYKEQALNMAMNSSKGNIGVKVKCISSNFEGSKLAKKSAKNYNCSITSQLEGKFAKKSSKKTYNISSNIKVVNYEDEEDEDDSEFENENDDFE